MSKVICDVCGTAYPETSSQCPICGCAKKSGNQTGAADTSAPVQEEAAGYSYVKGGRFSKKNVRKRNSNRTRAPERRNPGNRQEEEKTNMGLIVVVILLLLAIIAVVVYIGFRFFDPQGSDGNPSGTQSSNIGGNTNSDPTSPSQKGEVHATAIKLSCSTMELLAAGDTFELKVETEPVDATDTVIFTSSNKEVAMVSESGVVMAVGHGEAVITVTVGTVKAECTVVCSFGGTEQPDDPVEEFTFEFNVYGKPDENGVYDVTFDTRKTWTAYRTSLTVDPADITWTSDDPAVCTVDKGIVTIVGRGMTKIHAEYGGKTYTCIVRSRVPEVTEPVGDYRLSDADGDATLYIGGSDSFTLRLLDKDGNAMDVQWIAKDPSIVTIEGNKITGVKIGKTDVYTEYEGVTYTCIVRVSQK